MSRLKIAYLIDAALALVLIIVIPLLLDNNFEPANSLAYYLVAKICLGLVFVGGVIYGLFAKGANGTSTVLVGVATAYQFVPLLVRFLVLSAVKHADIIVLVTVIVLVMGYVALSFGLSYTDKKMIAREEKSAGEEIAIQEEKVSLKEDK